MECKQRPPAPGCHLSRVGCAVSVVTSPQVWPLSSLRNRAAGATPAYKTPRSAARPGSMCQMRSNFRPELSANLGLSVADSQCPPKSGEETTSQPNQESLAVAKMRPVRESNTALLTSRPGWNGPLAVQRRRSGLVKRNKPFLVPTSNKTLALIGVNWADGRVALATPTVHTRWRPAASNCFLAFSSRSDFTPGTASASAQEAASVR